MLSEMLLSSAQRELLGELREYATANRAQGAAEGSPHVPEVAAQLADRGWWGLTIDPGDGGPGGGFAEAALFAEQMFHAQLPIAGYLSTFITVAAVNAFGNAKQRAELLGAAAAGGVLAVSITEPDVGSDAAAVATRARREDSGAWVIDGHKRWCTMAHHASHILVFCRTADEPDRHAGLSMIFVPREADGLTISMIDTPVEDLTTELRLDGVRVPEDALLGAEGAGWSQAVAGLNVERMIIAASSLGLAQRAFDDALAYVKQRTQFGHAVGSFQAQQHRFADLATELEKTRLLVRAVAAAMDADPQRLLPREASMAKVTATELAQRCALEGMQAMGANGYASESGMERYLRAALGSTFFGGTSEIQRNIIAQTLGLGAR